VDNDVATHKALQGTNADKQDCFVADGKDVEATELPSRRIFDGEPGFSLAEAANRSGMADSATGCKTRGVMAGRDGRISRHASRNPSLAAAMSTRPYIAVDQDLCQSTRTEVETMDAAVSRKQHASKTGSLSKIPQGSVQSVDMQRTTSHGVEIEPGHVRGSLARICRALPGRWVPVSHLECHYLCSIPPELCISHTGMSTGRGNSS
jgi:hypothetical protein